MNSFQNKFPVIAIDGTACSGKGTLAKISRIFGFDHLDSGILYRIYAYELLRKKKKKVEEIENIKIDIQKLTNQTYYSKKDLRSETVSKTASLIAKNSFVREQLVELQRNFADNPPNKKGSVIDGRDITSVIIPNADVKFYVDANLHKRAKRRQIQLNLTDKYFSQVFDEMKFRDYNDKNRKISPLIKTKDSFTSTPQIFQKVKL